ncbi:MAG: sulfatase-like hydrolase/transferase [Bacteroidota bacterium]
MPKIVKNKNNRIFWLGFWALNLLLFLPGFIANWEFGTFFPSSSLDEKDGLAAGWIFLIRDNFDLFRLSIEWYLMTGGLLLLRKFRLPFRIFAWVFGLLYLVILLYQIYYAGSLSIYGQHPYFKNDFVLIKEVLPIFLDQVSGGSMSIYVFGAIGIAMLIGIVSIGYMVFVKRIQTFSIGRSFWIIWGFLGTLIIANLLLGGKHEYRKDYYTCVRTSALIHASMHLPNEEKFDRLAKLPLYANYLNMKLEQRPNVYLLFVESYGRAAATKKWVKNEYASAIEGIGDTLAAAGWHSASAYSVAPILGGKSWLSFTTVMTGVKIENHVHFTELLENYPDYPHIFRFLESQDYQTFRMKTFSQQKASTEEAYAFQQRFFDFDLWLKHPDIPYSGYEYDFHGGIPDQYAMNYLHEEVATDTTRPMGMFFITMASHVPWFPPPPLVEDWRMLDSIKTDPYEIEIPDSLTSRYDRFMARITDKLTPRYVTTILYDLRMLSQFIRQKADPNSIFIVLGDHQAPMVTYYGGDGLEVPVHIISQDTSFLNSLSEYGFNTGMEADTTLPAPMLHEGIYSMFMRELMSHYGVENQSIPVYLPEGI